jgi:ATP/maltotriose-dependent transcriptional regulator MalT
MAEKTRARTTREPSAPSAGVLYPAKVDVPARIPATIHRDRLFTALAEIPEKRVIVVMAPADTARQRPRIRAVPQGAGVLAHGRARRRPGHVPGYFLAAGRTGSRFSAAAGEIPTKLSAAAITDTLVSATRSANAEHIFILDDFHFLDDAPPELHKGIEGWLARMPDTCHVIIAGRTHPQLAPVPMLIARQQAKTIRHADFAFTADEIANLFRDVLQKDISLTTRSSWPT